MLLGRVSGIGKTRIWDGDTQFPPKRGVNTLSVGIPNLENVVIVVVVFVVVECCYFYIINNYC